MKVELFYFPGCVECDGARIQRKAVATPKSALPRGVRLVMAGLLAPVLWHRPAIPVANGAWSLGQLQHLRRVDADRRWFEATGGMTSMLFGASLLNGDYAWVPALAT